MSSAFTRGMPPPSSVLIVRASCDVANLCRLVPMPGTLSISRSNRAFWPGWRIQVENAIDAPTTAMMINRICERTNSEMPTMMRVDSGSCAPKLL